MNLQNHYWYFQSVIPPKVCDDIVRYANSIKDQIGVTGRFGNKKLNDSDISDLKRERNSNIVWLYDKWIYREIHPYIHRANENAGWNFEWDWSEACQFTKYGKGQYYDWHCDSFHAPYQRDDQNLFLSIIGPNEWDEIYIGSFRLDSNDKWEKVDI